LEAAEVLGSGFQEVYTREKELPLEANRRQDSGKNELSEEDNSLSLIVVKNTVNTECKKIFGA
jgi:hypothetical protein